MRDLNLQHTLYYVLICFRHSLCVMLMSSWQDWAVSVTVLQMHLSRPVFLWRFSFPAWIFLSKKYWTQMRSKHLLRQFLCFCVQPGSLKPSHSQRRLTFTLTDWFPFVDLQSWSRTASWFPRIPWSGSWRRSAAHWESNWKSWRKTAGHYFTF